MACLYHSTTLTDSKELPVQITNSFPPKGIAANILNNATIAKGTSFYLYGNVNSSPLPHTCCNSGRSSQQTKKNLTNGFSPPPTITEIKSLTRKTPRFYTVNSTNLRQCSDNVLPAVDKLIAQSEQTGLKDVFERICKGSKESLKTLMTRRQISHKMAFLQTSSPLRYYQKGQRNSDADKDSSNNRMNHGSQRVLVPSPYFSGDPQSKTITKELSSQLIFYSKYREARRYAKDEQKNPIEPTVINLHNKLPELPNNARLRARYQTKNIRGVKKQGGEGTMAIIADPTTNYSRP